MTHTAGSSLLEHTGIAAQPLTQWQMALALQTNPTTLAPPPPPFSQGPSLT